MSTRNVPTDTPPPEKMKELDAEQQAIMNRFFGDPTKMKPPTPEEQAIIDAFVNNPQLAPLEPPKEMIEDLQGPQEVAPRGGYVKLAGAPAPDTRPETGHHTIAEFDRIAALASIERRVPEEGTIMGNWFVMKTLDGNDDLEIYRRASAEPPLAQAKAYNQYAVAISLKSINGKPWHVRLPLGPEDDVLYEKFRLIGEWPTIITDYLAAEFIRLSNEFEQKALFAKKA